MRRRITNIPEVSLRVNGKPAKLTMASVIQGRLLDRVFSTDLEAVQAAAEIETALPAMNGSLVLSERAWKRLEQATRKPASAGYAPGCAAQLLPFLTAILEAEAVPDDG
jgi:hypothetical protein